MLRSLNASVKLHYNYWKRFFNCYNDRKLDNSFLNELYEVASIILVFFFEKQFTIVNDNLGTGPLGSVFLPKFSGNCGQAFNNKIGCCETIISFYSIHCDKGRTRLNQFLKNSTELQIVLLHSAS